MCLTLIQHHIGYFQPEASRMQPKTCKYIWIFKFVVTVERGIWIWSTLGDKDKGRGLVPLQIVLCHVNCNFALIVE